MHGCNLSAPPLNKAFRARLAKTDRAVLTWKISSSGYFNTWSSNIGVSSPENIALPQIGSFIPPLAKFDSSKLCRCSWKHSYSESAVFSDSVGI